MDDDSHDSRLFRRFLEGDDGGEVRAALANADELLALHRERIPRARGSHFECLCCVVRSHFVAPRAVLAHLRTKEHKQQRRRVLNEDRAQELERKKKKINSWFQRFLVVPVPGNPQPQALPVASGGRLSLASAAPPVSSGHSAPARPQAAGPSAAKAKLQDAANQVMRLGPTVGRMSIPGANVVARTNPACRNGRASQPSLQGVRAPSRPMSSAPPQYPVLGTVNVEPHLPEFFRDPAKGLPSPPSSFPDDDMKTKFFWEEYQKIMRLWEQQEREEPRGNLDFIPQLEEYRKQRARDGCNINAPGMADQTQEEFTLIKMGELAAMKAERKRQIDAVLMQRYGCSSLPPPEPVQKQPPARRSSGAKGRPPAAEPQPNPGPSRRGDDVGQPVTTTGSDAGARKRQSPTENRDVEGQPAKLPARNGLGGVPVHLPRPPPPPPLVPLRKPENDVFPPFGVPTGSSHLLDYPPPSVPSVLDGSVDQASMPGLYSLSLSSSPPLLPEPEPQPSTSSAELPGPVAGPGPGADSGLGSEDEDDNIDEGVDFRDSARLKKRIDEHLVDVAVEFGVLVSGGRLAELNGDAEHVSTLETEVRKSSMQKKLLRSVSEGTLRVLELAASALRLNRRTKWQQRPGGFDGTVFDEIKRVEKSIRFYVERAKKVAEEESRKKPPVAEDVITLEDDDDDDGGGGGARAADVKGPDVVDITGSDDEDAAKSDERVFLVNGVDVSDFKRMHLNDMDLGTSDAAIRLGCRVYLEANVDYLGLPDAEALNAFLEDFVVAVKDYLAARAAESS